MSSTIASATASVATSSVASGAAAQPASFKIIGILLAIGSGLFIGSSFVIKKMGLLSAQKKSGSVAGEGHSYLKSPLWWTGMTLMIIGEVLNFVAYAFTEAILVTPLGALSVVICAILSSIFLKETLTFFGKIGCLLCILGATIVALNGPQEQTTSTIPEFQKLFLSVGFLVFGSLVIVISLGLAFFVAPKYGKTHMLVYISICSLIGGLSVACTQGLGSSILTSIRGDNQFKHWFIYFLLGFVTITLLVEINYLNKALELFNTAMVTPTYYVLFTGCTLLTSVILYQGFKSSAVQIVTVVFGFLVICSGITLLQLSKVDPVEIKDKLDRRSTILLTAARSEIHHDGNSEKALEIEDPGIDALRGSFGAFGSIHRAISSRRSMRRERSFDPNEVRRRQRMQGDAEGEMALNEHGLVRHQLYDNPMPYDAADKISMHSTLGSPKPQYSLDGRERSSSIQFAPSDTLHIYNAKPGSSGARHEQQERLGNHVHGMRSPQNSLPLHPATPSSADIASSATFPAASDSNQGYPYPPDSMIHAEPASYTDPYSSRPDYMTSKSATMPRTQGSLIAHNLAQYSSSSPDVSSGLNIETPVSPGGTRTSRIKMPHMPHIPHFPRATSKDRRTPHPAGPADLEKEESAGLVHREDEYSDGEDGQRDSLDYRDQL